MSLVKHTPRIVGISWCKHLFSDFDAIDLCLIYSECGCCEHCFLHIFHGKFLLIYKYLSLAVPAV